MGHVGCLGLASPSTAVLAARGEILISRMKTPGLIHCGRDQISGRTIEDQRWLTDSSLAMDAGQPSKWIISGLLVMRPESRVVGRGSLS